MIQPVQISPSISISGIDIKVEKPLSEVKDKSALKKEIVSQISEAISNDPQVIGAIEQVIENY